MLLCAMTQMIPSFCELPRLIDCYFCIVDSNLLFWQVHQKPTKIETKDKRKIGRFFVSANELTELDRILHKKEIKNEALAYHKQNEHLII